MKMLLKLLVCLLVLLSVISSCSKQAEIDIVVIEKQDLPVVYFQTMFSAGSAVDPADKPGLAYFTAKLLNKGTASYSRSDIEDKLDKIGAELAISVDKEVVIISGKTLKENLVEFYKIYQEVITSPTFPADQIEKMKSVQIDQINRIREDDAALSLAVLENALFKNHRYGHLIQGRESAIQGFTKEDVALFYQQNYLRGNVIAGLAGAVDDSLIANFKTDLNKLPEGSIVRVSRKSTLLSNRHVILVEKENRSQSHLRIGHSLDFNRTDDDYYPMRLAGCYLGEHREMFGRYFKTVRVQRGLAYGAYAYTEHFQQAGWSKMQRNGICRYDQYFSTWTYPKEANFEFCIKLMQMEMEKLVEAEISEDDFQLVKSYVANNAAFLTETPDKQLGMLLDERWYKINGFTENFETNIKAVTAEDAHEAVKEYLHPSKTLIVVVVSNGLESKAELLSAQTTLELPTGATEGELKSINNEIKSFDLSLTAEDIEIVKASELFK